MYHVYLRDQMAVLKTLKFWAGVIFYKLLTKYGITFKSATFFSVIFLQLPAALFVPMF